MENEGFKFKYYFDSDDEEKEYDASYDEMYSYCQKKLYSDGYKIYTSIDLTMQQQLQDSIDLTLLDFTDPTKAIVSREAQSSRSLCIHHHLSVVRHRIPS